MLEQLSSARFLRGFEISVEKSAGNFCKNRALER